MISCTEAVERVQFTKDEERSLTKLEAVIDAAIRDGKFDGSPLTLQFSEQVSLKLAFALQRKYESGGWKCGVSPGAKLTVQLTPQALSAAAPASQASVKTVALPPVAPMQIALTQAQRVQTQCNRLLVRMPTRGRPAQALSVLQKYRDMAGVPVTLEVVIDGDDETMLAAEVQQRLCALGCAITVDYHGSKVEAVNGGCDDLVWEVLLLASDDMVPVVDGYGLRALAAMDEQFPQFDGAIYFDDGFQGEKVCTLPIVGRRWWQQNWCHVYSSEYQSLHCDVEQTELWKARGRLVYVDEKIIEHRHPSWGMTDRDALYDRNDALDQRDREVYERRKKTARPHAQWAFDQPPLWLSVLVCTIPERRAQLDHLLDHLWQQVGNLKQPLSVEILVDSTVGITTGVKHQRLVERARGHFVAFVDDDDFVSHDYLEHIVGLLEANPDADCLSLRGVMTTAGAAPEPFYHSIEVEEWGTRDGVHRRSPNHLNPVRRELALQTGFSKVHYVDDVDFGKRLRPLLKKEVPTDDRPLYFYFYAPQK